MGRQVFHGERDLGFVAVNSRLRACFMRFVPGQITRYHKHVHGDETFLVLRGQAELLIDGQGTVLGPGDLCVAGKGEMHSVRCIGDEPVSMFLVVAPNVEPTHTYSPGDGGQDISLYGVAARKERGLEGVAQESSLEKVIAEHLGEMEKLAGFVRSSEHNHRTEIVRLNQALQSGDARNAKAAVTRMAADVRATIERVSAMVDAWNMLAGQVAYEPPD